MRQLLITLAVISLLTVAVLYADKFGGPPVHQPSPPADTTLVDSTFADSLPDEPDL